MKKRGFTTLSVVLIILVILALIPILWGTVNFFLDKIGGDSKVEELYKARENCGETNVIPISCVHDPINDGVEVSINFLDSVTDNFRILVERRNDPNSVGIRKTYERKGKTENQKIIHSYPDNYFGDEEELSVIVTPGILVKGTDTVLLCESLKSEIDCTKK